MMILYLVVMSSFSLSLESSKQFTKSDCKTSYMYDQVHTKSMLQGEVSETLSEPCPEISALVLDAFHGAMTEYCDLALL
jgi:hypothetical protein